MNLPVPVADDHDTGGFFAAAARGRIALCFCAVCDEVLHLPRPHCAACGTSVIEWRDVAPFATVYSWTVIHHAGMPGFELPYTVALVELDEIPGVRLLAHFDGIAKLAPGTRVSARFDDVREGVVVPQWMVIDD